MTHTMNLATADFSIPFILFAAGFGLGMMLFMFAKSIERRYSEIFDAQSLANFSSKKFEYPRKAQPIEVELEAMQLRD
jgi:hypothetical protein